MTIEEAVLNIKAKLENNYTLTNGIRRSGKLIDNIHEATKYKIQDRLLAKGVNSILLPPIGEHTKGELKLSGFLKTKKQDICVIPNIQENIEDVKNSIALFGQSDKYGYEYTNRTLSINIRSQTSKITANTDTLFERTYAEALNLHLRCPDIVLGEVYLLSLYDYGKRKDKDGNILGDIGYLSSKTTERYINFFRSISHRNMKITHINGVNHIPFKYEVTCLLIVDFSKPIPKIYNSTEELINDKFLLPDTNVKYEGLEWDSFFDKILNIYNQRFGLQTLQH